MSPPPVPPPPEPGGSRPREPRAGVPPWVLPAAVVVALVAVSVTGTMAYTQRQEIERLRADIVAAEARISELENELAEGRGSGLGDLFGELFGEGGGSLDGLLDGGLEGGLGGGLDGLLDGFLGDGLDDLLGGADIGDLTRCLTGGAPGGLLDGLLGGSDPVVADTLPEQIEAIALRVASLRGLELREPVEPEFVPQGEFAALVRQLVSEDYTPTDADHDRRMLAALGAVDRGVDLRAMVLDLVGEQAAGFYDSDTRRLVVRADDPDTTLGPAGQLILAHEIEHAIADQNQGLPVDADAPDDADGQRAGLALVEGDATLLMQQYALGALGLMDQLAIAMDPSVTRSQDQLQGYPEYLQRELVFPYTQGLAFVCGLHADGGWPAVDAAYADPPSTTAQVLWPARYAAGEGAVAPGGLGDPGDGWSTARTDTLGAADLLWLFSAPGDDTGAALDAPLERAGAWAGGQVQLWVNGDDSAVGLALVQRDGERDLCDSLASWYAAAFPNARAAAATGEEAAAWTGPDQDAVVVCAGDAVRVGIAPDLATARRVGG